MLEKQVEEMVACLERWEEDRANKKKHMIKMLDLLLLLRKQKLHFPEYVVEFGTVLIDNKFFGEHKNEGKLLSPFFMMRTKRSPYSFSFET